MSAKRCHDVTGILGLLWEKIDADSFSDDELDFLGGAADHACTMSRNTADHLLGVAMHISDENAAGRDVKKINHVDLPVLLASLAETMEICGELAFIASEASFFATKRAEKKIESSCIERAKQSSSGDAP